MQTENCRCCGPSCNNHLPNTVFERLLCICGSMVCKELAVCDSRVRWSDGHLSMALRTPKASLCCVQDTRKQPLNFRVGEGALSGAMRARGTVFCERMEHKELPLLPARQCPTPNVAPGPS